MCSMHATRMRRHGNPDAVTHQRDRNLPRGLTHRSWTGAKATCTAAHQRVKAAKGTASNYACVDCGGQARHWSYDHKDPGELFEDGRAYSAKVEHYEPRCVPCHKRFDVALLRGQSHEVGQPVDLDEVRRLYALGVRSRPMARILGIGPERLRDIFDELGLAPYPRGRATAAQDAAATAEEAAARHKRSEQAATRRPYPSRFTEADRQQMRVLYDGGMSQAAIGKQFGTHGPTVGAILRSLGVEPRSPKDFRALSAEQCDAARLLRRAGVRLSEIAIVFGVSPSLIGNVTKEEAA